MRQFSAVLLSCAALLSAFSLVIGHAATLEVRGGVAQTFRSEVEPLPTVDLWVELREYKGESGKLSAIRTLGPYQLTDGQPYHLDYQGQGAQLRTCPAALGLSEPRTGGPFTPPPDLTHVVCVQQAQDGEVVVRAGASDGPIVSPS